LSGDVLAETGGVQRARAAAAARRGSPVQELIGGIPDPVALLDGRARADSRPGIEPRHRKRIFERFYRVDSGRSRDAGGTGLGLAIVKHLVQAQDGQVGVESGRGGSRFWVRLPVAT
jgi:hypothetical protein